jgi:hypothetical protein
VKLDHAIRRAAQATTSLSGEDRVAVTVLVELGKRVAAVRKAIRQLATAVDPETDLNQSELFGPPEDS